MKDKSNSNSTSQSDVQGIAQPEPFTPGVTKGMVRQHAYELYRDKLAHESPLTLDDWVMAEKDLVHSMQTDNLPR